MQPRTFHIFLILFAFVLYTIPLCQCVNMVESPASCCSAFSHSESSTPKACTDETGCCADGINAEKMNTEKSIESANVSLASPELLSVVWYPAFATSSKGFALIDASIIHLRPTQAFLQVFLI